MIRTGLVLVALGALGACGEPATTTALFAVPGVTAGDDFYALPFPNNLHRRDDGTLDLAMFPANSLVVDQFRAAAEQLDGFALNAAMFARFDGPLDPASLPDPAGSVAPTASVYVVNLDPSSADRGARTPVLVTFRADPTQTLGTNNLAVRPFPGFTLDEGTTYALVITTRVRDLAGAAIAPSADFLALRGAGGAAGITAARAVYQPLLDYLDEPGGDERGDVASAAVFTTQHATFVGAAIRKAVFATPAPVPASVMSTTDNATFKVFVGSYTAPNFQVGDVPYKNSPNGEIKFQSGAAVVQRTETMRFALSVPAGPVPTGGFPIVIYAHGTGGDFGSFISDGTANNLAKEGLAVISTDQVLHGPRNPGGNPELDFFNFGNVYAARDNALQGYADGFSQLRLASAISIDDGGTRTITLDLNNLFFFGHSQGGATGPGFVAFEPACKGAVFSGTAGVLYVNLLHKTQPLDIPALVSTFLRDEPVDENNPSLAIVQLWMERADPVNYAPLMVRRPAIVDGVQLAPRNIFQTEGFIDTYSPNPGIEAFATAIGGDLVVLPDEKDLTGLTLQSRTPKATPFTGNLDGATAVLAQYKQKSGSDGHFVVFDIPSARQQSSTFLGSLARTGHATVVTPQ